MILWLSFFFKGDICFVTLSRNPTTITDQIFFSFRIRCKINLIFTTWLSFINPETILLHIHHFNLNIVVVFLIMKGLFIIVLHTSLIDLLLNSWQCSISLDGCFLSICCQPNLLLDHFHIICLWKSLCMRMVGDRIRLLKATRCCYFLQSGKMLLFAILQSD